MPLFAIDLFRDNMKILSPRIMYFNILKDSLFRLSLLRCDFELWKYPQLLFLLQTYPSERIFMEIYKIKGKFL